MEQMKDREKRIWVIERKNAELEVELKGTKAQVEDREVIQLKNKFTFLKFSIQKRDYQ
jgi:hypothetical protein